tara:strand:- start:75734 stop:75940 length:207 start_codon:yes stop_codon:yes gene_type:complete
MTLGEVTKALSALRDKLPNDPDLKVRLIGHDDSFHFAPTYEILVTDGEVVLSGVPPELAKAYGLDERN